MRHYFKYIANNSIKGDLIHAQEPSVEPKHAALDLVRPIYQECLTELTCAGTF